MATYLFTCTRCKKPVLANVGETTGIVKYTTTRQKILLSNYGGCEDVYTHGDPMRDGSLCDECGEQFFKWLERK